MPHDAIFKVARFDNAHRLLPRFSETRREYERQVSKAIIETGGGLPVQITLPRSAEGDPRRLRGIPVVGARGVGGAIDGTRPEPHALRELAPS